MRSKWWGWGEPDARYPEALLPRFLRYLEAQDIRLTPPEGPPEPPAVPPTTLTEGDLEALRAVCEVRLDGEERLAHSLGKSYVDLLVARTGGLDRLTDAVAYPQAMREIAGLLRVAASRGVAVVPFGGGTSVLGGVSPVRGAHHAVLTADLRRLNKVLEIDSESALARVEAGIAGPDLERALEGQGLTLGHFPQSFHFSTVGGWIATRSAGHASGRYGRMENLVQSLTVVTPAGEVRTAEVPARSTGPELTQLFLGSEGTLGIVVEAMVRLRRKPEVTAARGFLLPSFPQALARCREMIQAGIRPATVRVSNAEETRALMASRGLKSHGAGSFVLLEFEGPAAQVPEEMGRAVEHWTEGRVWDLGGEAAADWEEEYFRAPYLRDDLLDRGLLVETLETAATWSNLETLYAGVKEALEDAYRAEGTAGLVLCHLSHAYGDGASLYFTLLTSRARGKERAQWGALKEAATERILDLGGTLSHHHGIGLDHRRWMEREHGPVGMRALRALKATLDPQGIMNPGKVWEDGS
ncbi:MAG: FAD-binding oxidoreductase [Thermoplasmata archaeon]